MTCCLSVLLITALVATAWGCADRGPEPFVSAPDTLTRTRGVPPACFTGPLVDCFADPSELSRAERLASPWSYPFHPDLHHRVCRGDQEARRRLLEALRKLEANEGPRGMTPVGRRLLHGCESPSFCDWAQTVAADPTKPVHVRKLLFDTASRACEMTITMSAIATDDATGLALAVEPLLESKPKPVSSTSQRRCAALERPEQAWDDLLALRSAGCLDLGAWLEAHRNDPAGTAAALERCIDGREIRYREADCLRELAGLDRDRAVAFVEGHDRRGWGMSSSITPYARTLLQFPQAGQLDAELAGLGLISATSSPTTSPGHSPVLAHELLESHGRLARFNPSCSVRYCEHAPLMYRLADLVSPELDGLIIAERWPALEQVDLGDGPHAVATSVRGIPVTFQVQGHANENRYDESHYQRLRSEFERALEAPHELILYIGRRVYRLPIRFLGEWYDLEALLGGLNTVLAAHGSDQRYLTLDPHCIPCARVLAGPGDGIIAAAVAGLITPVDPFKELWTLPNFDPARVQR